MSRYKIFVICQVMLLLASSWPLSVVADDGVSYKTVKRHMERLRKLKKQVQKHTERLHQTKREKNAAKLELMSKIARLIAERDQSLKEMREGYYCNKCWRTKTQIEAQTRQSFEGHLDKVNGQRVSAPADKIKAKEEEYNKKIAKLQAELKNFELNATSFDKEIANISSLAETIRTVKIPAAQREVQGSAEVWRDNRRADVLTKKEALYRGPEQAAQQVGAAEVRLKKMQDQLKKYNKDYLDQYTKKSQEIQRRVEARKAKVKQQAAAFKQKVDNFKSKTAAELEQLESKIDQAQRQHQQAKQKLAGVKDLSSDEAKALKQQVTRYQGAVRTAKQMLAKRRATVRSQTYSMQKKLSSLNAQSAKINADSGKMIRDFQAQLDRAFRAKERALKNEIERQRQQISTLRDLYRKEEDRRLKETDQYVSKVNKERSDVRSICSEAGVSCNVDDDVLTKKQKRELDNRIKAKIVKMLMGKPCAGCPSYEKLMDQGDAVNGVILDALKSESQKSAEAKKEQKERLNRRLDLLQQNLESN